MRNLYVRLSDYSFIRIYDDGSLGYIMNEKNNLEKIYDEIGADFLAELKRTPTPIKEIEKNLKNLYRNIDSDLLHKDLINFLEELYNNEFIEISNTSDEDKLQYDIIKNNQIHFLDNSINNLPETQRFLFVHDSQKPTLRTIHIELTNKCNERCVHCFIPNNEKEHGVHFRLKNLKRVLNEFKELGGVRIILSGGEPLLHPDFIEIIKFCRELDLSISIFSNLISCDDHLIEAIKDVRVANLQVSLYSVIEKEHDHITKVTGSYKKTIGAIEKLRKKGIPVSISCPLMKINKNSFTQLIHYAISQKIPYKTDIYLMGQTDFTKDNLSERLSVNEIAEVIKALKKINSSSEIFGQEKYETKSHSSYNLPVCSAAINMLCISSNGDVYPCVSLSKKKCGNIYETSLKEIWNHSKELNEIRNIRQSDFPKCKDCGSKEYCNMCMGKNCFENNGDILKIPEYCCDLAHATKSVME